MHAHRVPSLQRQANFAAILRSTFHGKEQWRGESRKYSRIEAHYQMSGLGVSGEQGSVSRSAHVSRPTSMSVRLSGVLAAEAGETRSNRYFSVPP
jgi:hypothetical protein